MGLSSADFYEIWVKEPLDPSWSEWLNDFDVMRIAGQATRIAGQVKDQTALYGLINKIRDLNLTLICIKKLS
jgi:hypothetical protein